MTKVLGVKTETLDSILCRKHDMYFKSPHSGMRLPATRWLTLLPPTILEDTKYILQESPETDGEHAIMEWRDGDLELYLYEVR